ncbi:hypothetical protein DSCW_48590 [Desulfosarcina widdelii]|uniref:Uncharacterized protein n=1 Tax=Desulfosarcina widdelii TaxID=947919 RepID=A0A5K7Z609_9BACT|nr:DUF6488 family protein [Desulfosarcina widdelii]BBO77442.1 hypothetical protein DSCW_48590 [Desulfosarcina widdelii]
MNSYTTRRHIWFVITIALITLGVIVSGTEIANSHGGKTHGEEAFTAFQAVQKATQLYDRLIVSGKLPEDWETDLVSIHISARGDETSRETVVQFKRTGGDPESLYFYFDHRGEYSGSNFTGK